VLKIPFNDFLKDLQNNPLLTNSSSVTIVNNPFVSTTNTRASQNTTNAQKFGMDAIISQNTNLISILLNSTQNSSSNQLFSNIGMNTETNSSNLMDNMFKNANNSSNANNPSDVNTIIHISSASNTDMDFMGNINIQTSSNLPWSNFNNTPSQKNSNNLLERLSMNNGGFQNKGGLSLGLWNNNSNNSLNNLFGNQISSQNNGFKSNLQENGFNSLLHVLIKIEAYNIKDR
jgi:hypothetical protein